jgi:hypothetical protein
MRAWHIGQFRLFRAGGALNQRIMRCVKSRSPKLAASVLMRREKAHSAEAHSAATHPAATHFAPRPTIILESDLLREERFGSLKSDFRSLNMKVDLALGSCNAARPDTGSKRAESKGC